MIAESHLMPSAKDVSGTAFEYGSAVFMVRIVDAAGANVQQSGIASINYSIYEIDSPTAVAGHDTVNLDVVDVIFDELQTGGLWTVDEVGYNFRHEIDVSTSEAFAKAGVQYQVRYELTPTTGQKTIVRFQLRVI